MTSSKEREEKNTKKGNGEKRADMIQLQLLLFVKKTGQGG